MKINMVQKARYICFLTRFESANLEFIIELGQDKLHEFFTYFSDGNNKLIKSI